MTKVRILDQETTKKPIKLISCLMKGCNMVNENENTFTKDFLKPSRYAEIILIVKDYGGKDIMLCIEKTGEKILMFGKFNDGVV